MRPPNRIIRGLKDIRTRSGTPDQVLVPHKAYLAISVLEMEKFRRETERDNLMVRSNNVNTRLEAIESEKAALLQRLGKAPTGKPIRRFANSKPTKDYAPDGNVGGFKFQY